MESLCRYKKGEPVEYYYAGIFTPLGSKVLNGLFYQDFHENLQSAPASETSESSLERLPDAIDAISDAY
jgi:hypothetical protein